MHVHPPHLAVRLGKKQRFFAVYEDGGTAEKMGLDDRTTRSDCASAFDEGDGTLGYRSYQAMQLSNPSAIISRGRLRPMKTMRLWRFSSVFQGR